MESDYYKFNSVITAYQSLKVYLTYDIFSVFSHHHLYCPLQANYIISFLLSFTYRSKCRDLFPAAKVMLLKV